jgi:predicted ATPase
VGDTSTITQIGTLVGTLNYISPEACRGQPLDARSDIWSFGVMLFELLTGTRPFDGEQVAAIVTAILTQPIPDLEALCPAAPVALVDLVYRMLEKNRDARIPSMRQVGAELEAILRGRAPQPLVLAQDAPPPPPAPVRELIKQGLQIQLTPFVGRETELDELDRLMRNPQTQLVTITGPGGMGKTRLALEYAARQVGRFPNGVYFIPLGGLSRVEDIVTAIADSVYFTFAPVGDRQRQLLHFLGSPDEQHMLLVLDNFDHLLDAAPLVTAIMRAAPDLRVLTTSRIRLNLSGEVVYDLDGMDIPDRFNPDVVREFSAVRLFEQGAQHALPGFELHDDDLSHVLRICRSVHGNPLGIVLAAAWAEMLSPQEIADEIEISLDFLQTDARDVPERQRSLRAIFDSSWNMLTDTERDVYMKLSIFRGGVKRAVAQYITGASLQTLAALVKKSLVRRNPETGRYEIHELLRQFAAEALEASGQVSITRDVHCHFFFSLIARHLDDLRGQQQALAIREIDADFENARAAWSWAVQRQDTGLIALALDGLLLFCFLAGEYDTLADLLREAKARLTPQSELWYRLAVRCELAHTPNGDPAQVAACLDAARAAGDRAEEAFCTWTLGYCRCAAGEYAQAVPVFAQSLALYQDVGDPFFTGRVMSDLGLFCAVIGQHAESVHLLMQSGELQRQIGDQAGAAQSMMRNALNVDFLAAAGLL